jgi:hypothetical protein
MSVCFDNFHWVISVSTKKNFCWKFYLSQDYGQAPSDSKTHQLLEKTWCCYQRWWINNLDKPLVILWLTSQTVMSTGRWWRYNMAVMWYAYQSAGIWFGHPQGCPNVRSILGRIKNDTRYHEKMIMNVSKTLTLPRAFQGHWRRYLKDVDIDKYC